MLNISLFIEEERKRYGGRDNDLFAFSIGAIQRNYERAWRFREWSKPFIEEYGKLFEDPHNLDPQQMGMPSTSELTKNIELLFASFFVFSSILCDDIAQIFINMFGPVRDIKIGSHRKLSENFGHYAKSLSLTYDASFIELAEYLESELCDYRDKQLVHDINYRKVGVVSYSNTLKDVVLTYGLLYPKPTDKYIISKSWGELLGSLDRYVGMTLEIIRDNADKIKLSKNEERA